MMNILMNILMNCEVYSNMADDTEYRQLKRDFINNLNGTTPFEISVVTSLIPLTVILRSFVFHFVYQRNKNEFSSRVTMVMDYCTLIVPLLLMFTILADYATLIVILSFILLAFGNAGKLSQLLVEADIPLNSNDTKPFLCNFRAFVNIATAIAILAVDFTIFPRRFAKTETFGTGLLDVGVGSFIVSNAIVSHEARGLSSSLFQSIKKELKAVSLLVCFGLARLVAVKSTDYQEHISEYGVHWNFFLTLATVRVFSTICLGMLPFTLRQQPWLVGVMIGILYQYALDNGLQDFVLYGSVGDGSRLNLVDANREGICSSFGYLSLYFIALELGKLIFKNRSHKKCFLWFVFISFLSFVIYWTEYFGLISRRMANFSFVLWQISYNVQLLCLFLAVDIFMKCNSSKTPFLFHPGGCQRCSNQIKDRRQDGVSNNQHDDETEEKQCTCLISAVNFNQLAYFLIANLLTGLVNICVQTINSSVLNAFLILNVYLMVLNGMIVFLYKNKLPLKL